MKLKIFSLLIAVLMSTAVLTACSKAPAGAESSGGSGESGAQSESSAEESRSESGEISVTVTAHTNFELKNGGFEPQLTLTLPADAAISGEGDSAKAEFPDGSVFFIGWTFLHEKKEYSYDNPLYYYENPEKSAGYVSHESLHCGEYDCLRIITVASGEKNDTKSDAYYYEYFVDLNNGEIFYCSFLVQKDFDEETILRQEKIIASAKRPTPPAGTFAAEWSGFSVYLPEESALADYGEKIAVKGDALCTGSGDSAAEFAKIISADPVENAAAPFERCDEQYGSEAQAISDSEPDAGRKYRAYDFQTAVQTEAFGEVYENKTVYCLLAGDKVVVIEFYPLRGIGTGTQKAEFEKILCSLAE